MPYYVIACSSESAPVIPIDGTIGIHNCTNPQWIQIPVNVELRLPQAHTTDLIATFSLFWGIVVSIGLLAFFAGLIVKFIWHPSMRS